MMMMMSTVVSYREFEDVKLGGSAVEHRDASYHIW